MPKLKINIITLFPDYFSSALQSSLLARAQKNDLLEVSCIDLRDYSINKHRQVDDSPYGGGHGMLLMIEPIKAALDSIKEETYKVLLTPRGYLWSQASCRSLQSQLQNEKKSLTLLCGHYEGVDERVVRYVDASIRIGDFILSGGEPAALCILDSISRYIPGFVGNSGSLDDESFNESNYIEYPQYTRPEEFNGDHVPEILLSGHHKNIKNWRREQSIRASEHFKGDAKIDDSQKQS